MASNRPAPEAPYGASYDTTGSAASYDTIGSTASYDTIGSTASFAPFGSFGHQDPSDRHEPGAPAGEWNPTEETVRPVRGRHRVVKQRGGLARSSTVLGVGVIAAVGAGGMATAQDKPRLAISLPDLPDASSLPGIGELVSDDGADATPTGGATANDPEPLAGITAALPAAEVRGAAADTGAGAGRPCGPASCSRPSSSRPPRRRRPGPPRRRLPPRPPPRRPRRSRRPPRRPRKSSASARRRSASAPRPKPPPRPRPSASPSWPPATRCRPRPTRSLPPTARPAPCGRPATTPAWTWPRPRAPR